VESTRLAYPAANVVIVSHGSQLKLLLRDALGGGDQVLHRLVLDPCGLSIIETWPDGGTAVPRVNDTCHLAGQSGGRSGRNSDPPAWREQQTQGQPECAPQGGQLGQ